MCAEVNPLSLADICTEGNALVRRLIAIQKKNHLSDTKFAERLNIHRVHWSRIRHKQQRPGTKFVANAFKAYPDELYDIDLTTLFCPAGVCQNNLKQLSIPEGSSALFVTNRNGLTLYVMSDK